MTKRLFIVIAFVLLVAALAAGCGGGGAPSVPGDAVAVVGKDTITKSDFNFWFGTAKAV